MPATKTLPEDISGIEIPDKKLRILHLEDLPSDALLIDKALKKGKVDYECLVVDTRVKFINALKEFSPDIILADHSLPSFNSLDALVLFHESKMQIPFILVTATISEEFAADIIKKGADDYILKDRLKRLPIAIYNSLEKFRLKKEQQNSFDELIKKEKKYHALVENGSDGIVILSAEGKPSYVSQSASRILGYTQQEAMQLNLFALIHPDDRDGTTERMRICLNTPAIALDRIVSRVKHKDGSWRWMEATMTNMLHEPAINGIVENFRDITERKVAEQRQMETSGALEEALADLNKILDSSLDVICTINGNGEFVNVSAASQQVWGYKPEELVGTRVMNLVYEEDANITVKASEKIVSGTQVPTFENRYVHKSGRIIPILWSVNWDENLQLMFCIAKDVTEKKNLEDLLDKSNRMARIGSWEYNILTQTHFWSPITREIYEVNEELTPDLQTGIAFYNSGASRASISNAVNKAMKDGTSWDLELQIVTAKGNELWVHDIGEAEFINGKCIRLYGSFQDIDARKKAEIETLKAYEEKNIILESIGDAFFAVDKNWMVTYWNKEADRMLATPKDKIINKNLWDIFSDSIDSESYKKYHEAIETNEVISFEDYYAALDKWFEISAYPSATGLSVFFKDVSERKNSEVEFKRLNAILQEHAKELAISNQELEQFAYVASHDLQEPLRMVTSFLSQIEKKYGSIIDDKGRQYIHFAVDGAKRMRQIILDLLEFSRVGRTDDQVEDVDLNELLKEILELLRKQIEEKKAVINVGELPVIKTSMSPIRQVFQNLISNSLVYQKKGELPEISITVKDYDNYWEFAVTDNGIGIDPEYFDKIFTIFQRLHNKDEYSGTGIGLAITKKIIETMGGRIWVESEEGKGSTFYFTMPKLLN